MTSGVGTPRIRLEPLEPGSRCVGWVVIVWSLTCRRVWVVLFLIVAVSSASLLAWSGVQAAGPTITADSVVADAGGTFSVPIRLSESLIGVAGFDIVVTASGPDVVEITGAEFPAFGLTQDLLSTTTEIRLSAVDLMGVLEAGATDALLVTVNLNAIVPGVATIAIEVIRLDDEDGFPMNPTTVSGTVTVSNLAPAVDAGTDVVVEKRDPLLVSGTFSDPGGSTWTATVDYGDGLGADALPLGEGTFDLSHVYDEEGVYTVTVTVMDSFGLAGFDTFLVTVTFPTLPGMDGPAQDLDGDGTAEDVNGNGLLDFADVLNLFLLLDSPEVQENKPDFDFNANGAADMADVVSIFDMLLASAA